MHYTPDSLISPGFNNSCFTKAIAEYDLCITSKLHEKDIYYKSGAKEVFLTYSGYEPTIHRPIKLNKADLDLYGCDVAFAGERLDERSLSICELAKRTNYKIHLYGRNWNKGKGPNPS